MTSPDLQVDANPVRLQILQQTGICAALQQLLQMRNPVMPAVVAQLIGTLVLAGPQAADQIAAQPSIIAGLARLLQPSSVRASLFARDISMAVNAIMQLSSSKVAAERLAAEPGVFAGLVGVLTATADEAAARAAPIASFALLQTATKISSSRVMRMLQQQPDAIAALSDLLDSQHSHELQGQALRVLHALVRALLVDSAADNAAAPRIVKQLAGQRGMLPNLVRLLRRRLPDLQGAQQGDQEMQALSLLSHIATFAGAAAKDELLATPRALPAAVRMLNNKNKTARAMAAGLLWSLSTGGCGLTGWLLPCSIDWQHFEFNPNLGYWVDMAEMADASMTQHRYAVAHLDASVLSEVTWEPDLASCLPGSAQVHAQLRPSCAVPPADFHSQDAPIWSVHHDMLTPWQRKYT
jgi:hypothetical protein